MKTTVDLPDALFRRAKANAAERGISLKRLITEALQLKLTAGGTEDGAELKPWVRAIDQLPAVPQDDLDQIDGLIEEGRQQDLVTQHRDPR